jgi:hypothetical protein
MAAFGSMIFAELPLGGGLTLPSLASLNCLTSLDLGFVFF